MAVRGCGSCSCWPLLTLFLCVSLAAAADGGLNAPATRQQTTPDEILLPRRQNPLPPAHREAAFQAFDGFQPPSVAGRVPGRGIVDDAAARVPLQADERDDIQDATNPLEELHHALETLQSRYFELWLGTWPDAIDWTAAVMNTFVSATLHSLTKSLDYVLPSQLSVEAQRIENEINKYFSQSVSYYFGQNAFSIRTQAYDDMLWVVLGWLENIKFIDFHTTAHYPPSHDSARSGTWYGKQFEASFAHRAHVFYDLASRGWDTKLCGGGMVWNPHLTPYKNAITNQLFITASVGMYLYFPGDDNASPFLSDAAPSSSSDLLFEGLPPARPHDPRHLEAAITAYAWLRASNMTNGQGLYVDGFHIHGWGRNGSIGTGQCDMRNEMVYTYNQGVLLSGLRGLWEGTGRLAYLEDGHRLVRSVIGATGFDLALASPTAGPPSRRWSGLGAAGILEDFCDSFGRCNQDGQTFKGIFFHHLAAFCAPLPATPRLPGKTVAAGPAERSLHRRSCIEYAPWVARNARAAMGTRDSEGRFGGWWGAGRRRMACQEQEEEEEEEARLPKGAVDYRNDWTADGDGWKGTRDGGIKPQAHDFDGPEKIESTYHTRPPSLDQPNQRTQDANDRGRGRTVETQGGGVAVLRALWELASMYESE